MDPQKNPEPTGGVPPPIKLQYDENGKRLTWITSSAIAGGMSCTLTINCEEIGLLVPVKIANAQEYKIAELYRAKISVAGFDLKPGMLVKAGVVYKDSTQKWDSGDLLEFKLPEIVLEPQPEVQKPVKKEAWYIRVKLLVAEYSYDWKQTWIHWRSQPKPAKPPRKPFKLPSFLKFKLKQQNSQPPAANPPAPHQPLKPQSNGWSKLRIQITAVVVSFFKRQPPQKPPTKKKKGASMKKKTCSFCQWSYRWWQLICEKILPIIGFIALLGILGWAVILGYKGLTGSGTPSAPVAAQSAVPVFMPSGVVSGSTQAVSTITFPFPSIGNFTGSSNVVNITVVGGNYYPQVTSSTNMVAPVVSPTVAPAQSVVTPTNTPSAPQTNAAPARVPTQVVPVPDDLDRDDLSFQTQPRPQQVAMMKSFPEDYQLDNVKPLKPKGNQCVLKEILPVGKYYAYTAPYGWTVIMETDTPYRHGYRQSIGGEEVAYGEHRFGNSLEYLNTWNKDIVLTFRCTKNPPPQGQLCDTGLF
ncbi:MAG: hypothetical protein QG640_590 [Patescibacteria group bacterium]|nr:hypothetical protein [Patescibacteria group bacterium]